MLDEADKLLDMDFEEEIDQVLKVRHAVGQMGFYLKYGTDCR